MVTIKCKISEKLDAQLEALARRQRIPKSAIVRQALEQKLKKETTRVWPRAFDLNQ